MKLPSLIWCLCGLAILTSNACRKKSEVGERLGRLEAEFPVTVTDSKTAQAPNDAQAYVQHAIASVHSNDYVGGVVTLQMIQQMPAMTPHQLKAIHEAMQTLTADLVARAAQGDAKAKADLAAIERTRSQ